jgi:hypothetical protein
MKKSLITGLAAILLAGLPLTAQVQKRQYVRGNVHDVKYELTTEKNFPKYKIEEQCLFDNCYTFWNHTPGKDQLNFWVSYKNEESITFQDGKQIEMDSPKYIPEKISNRINVTNLAVERTSYEKLKRRAKKSQSFGFSVDITDRDMKFELPEIDVKGTKYIALKEMIDNSAEQTDLPFYLIPKTKGTIIFFPNNSFIEENGYEIQAQIVCDEESGVYQPILKDENEKPSSNNYGNYHSGLVNEKKEEWQGNEKETDYMRYAREKENSLEKEVQTQVSGNTQTKKEKPCYYTIKKGDKGFWSISGKILNNEKRYIEIQNLNPNIKSKDLKVGQKILVPCK